MTDLQLSVNGQSLSAKWLPENQVVQAELRTALPLSGRAARWGDELYLTIPVEADPEVTMREVSPGTIAYWPDAPAICVFWGPTPASTDDTPVAASPVAPVAQLADIIPLSAITGPADLVITEN